MKKWILIAIVAFALVFLLVSTGSTSACVGRWACGDRVIRIDGAGQLCINQKLLTINAASGADVYIRVPGNAMVNQDVQSCGGALTAMPADLVTRDAPRKTLRISAFTNPDTPVEFTYDGEDATLSSPNGVILVKFSTR